MKKIVIACAFFLLLAINAWLAWPSIRVFAPTYDEPVHLTAGYVYWKTGDYRMNGMHHPPFAEMWSALPLLFLKPAPLLPMGHPAWATQSWTPSDQYGFADLFLYHNRVSAGSMIAAGRIMQWILQCCMGALLVVVAWRLAGASASALVAVAWAFSPVFLAHGTQISTDSEFAVFYFAFFAAWAVAPTRWRGVSAGATMGLCFASKYFAVALLPSLAVCLAWEAGIEKKKTDWISLLVMAPVALFVVAAVYQFHGLGIFWDGLANLLRRAEVGRSSFFLGRHGTSGWLLYFPVTLLIKTPLGALLAGVAGGLLLWKSKRWPCYLWIAPLLFFGVSCLSSVQIGHRYILVCYPFLTLAVSGLATSTSAALGAGVALLLWQAAATVWVRPHYLAYFNELVGGPASGYRYLTDSNVDWGQALSLLPAALTPEEKEKGIYLSYFGTADPNAYGLRHLDIGSTGVIVHGDDSMLNLAPTTLVISATNLQSTYYADKQLFDWLKNIPPRAVVGYSLFIYDLSGHPEKLDLLRRLRS